MSWVCLIPYETKHSRATTASWPKGAATAPPASCVTGGWRSISLKKRITDKVSSTRIAARAFPGHGCLENLKKNSYANRRTQPPGWQNRIQARLRPGSIGGIRQQTPRQRLLGNVRLSGVHQPLSHYRATRFRHHSYRLYPERENGGEQKPQALSF